MAIYMQKEKTNKSYYLDSYLTLYTKINPRGIADHVKVKLINSSRR